MRRGMLFGVVAVLVAVLAPSSLARVPSPPKRVVELSVLPANAPKDARPAKVMTLEGEAGAVGIPDLGRFGFTPSFRKGDDKTVVVAISDMGSTPARELGKVDVPVGGKAVQSRTKPAFGIQVTQVIQPK